MMTIISRVVERLPDILQALFVNVVMVFIGYIVAISQVKRERSISEQYKLKEERYKHLLVMLDDTANLIIDLVKTKKNVFSSVKDKIAKMQLDISKYGSENDKRIFCGLISQTYYLMNKEDKNYNLEESISLFTYLLLLKESVLSECGLDYCNPAYEYWSNFIDFVNHENDIEIIHNNIVKTLRLKGDFRYKNIKKYMGYKNKNKNKKK